MKKGIGPIIIVSSAALLCLLLFKKTKKEKQNQNEKKILQNLSFEKMLNARTILASKENEPHQKTLIKISFPAPCELDPRKLLGEIRTIKKFSQNNEYSSYQATTETPIEFGIEVISPAPAFEIKKRTNQLYKRYNETAALFSEATAPYIETQLKNTKWVKDIMDGTAEQERILFRSEAKRDGFVLLPDEHYVEGKTGLPEMHMIALPADPAISCLRGLRQEHIPLLRNIRNTSYGILEKKLTVPVEELCAFVHYFPTFFYFHVHFVHVSSKRPFKGAHLLDDIIGNLTQNGLYYEKADLTVFLGEFRHAAVIEKFRSVEQNHQESLK